MKAKDTVNLFTSNLAEIEIFYRNKSDYQIWKRSVEAGIPMRSCKGSGALR